ncbi:hypothetical protein NDU88_004231 [Pleurodeles waltl]|uniref:Uncharacterized protein n=1 Tax=Pleurodeles waltl TaxID=8319 RepID=A0AAV7SI61_PLEWA|nr:hypothetical protein NDU88_004231 [Pleurodeles waltl]
MLPPVSATAGIPRFERPGGTSSRSLCVRATPPGTAGGVSSELRPRRSPPCPPFFIKIDFLDQQYPISVEEQDSDDR